MTTPGGTALPNYGSIDTSGGTTAPTDSSGAIDIWDLPADVKGHVIWFDTGTTPAATAGGSQAAQRLAKANPGEVNVAKLSAPHSFEVQASAEDVMKQFAAMSQTDPTNFAAIQKELSDAGFYGAAASVYGGWNQQTETAVKDAMLQYIKVSEGAGVPVSFLDFLKNTAAANTGINGNGGTGGTGSSAPVLSDPDTLRRYAQEAAQAALGRNLTPNQLDTFVSQFHNQQIQSYTDAANHNGLSSQKDDPRASAVSFVTGSNQQEFGQHQIQGYTDAFLNMFLPSGSSAPNVPVDPSAVSY